MQLLAQYSTLTAPERETIINFCDADSGVASIYTSQAPMMARLRRHPAAKLLARHHLGKAIVAEEYELPASCLAILRRPRASLWVGMLRAGRGGREMPPGVRTRRGDTLSDRSRGQSGLLSGDLGGSGNATERQRGGRQE